MLLDILQLGLLFFSRNENLPRLDSETALIFISIIDLDDTRDIGAQSCCSV